MDFGSWYVSLVLKRTGVTSPAVVPWNCSHRRWQTRPGVQFFKKSCQMYPNGEDYNGIIISLEVLEYDCVSIQMWKYHWNNYIGMLTILENILECSPCKTLSSLQVRDAGCCNDDDINPLVTTMDASPNWATADLPPFFQSTAHSCHMLHTPISSCNPNQWALPPCFPLPWVFSHNLQCALVLIQVRRRSYRLPRRSRNQWNRQCHCSHKIQWATSSLGLIINWCHGKTHGFL